MRRVGGRLHCMKGMDRTGIVVALHRVINEGWTPRAAENERDAIGFNGWLVFLDRYYDHKAERYAVAHRVPPAAGSMRTVAAP